jgi:hypothetical protein
LSASQIEGLRGGGRYPESLSSPPPGVLRPARPRD